jgi:hypothetical protein
MAMAIVLATGREVFNDRLTPLGERLPMGTDSLPYSRKNV